MGVLRSLRRRSLFPFSWDDDNIDVGIPGQLYGAAGSTCISQWLADKITLFAKEERSYLHPSASMWAS